MSGSSPGLQKSQKAGRSVLRPYKEMTLLAAFHCQGDSVAAAEAESGAAALEMAATAKASLSSKRSTSCAPAERATSLSRSQPVFWRSLLTASTGAIMTHLG